MFNKGFIVLEIKLKALLTIELTIPVPWVYNEFKICLAPRTLTSVSSGNISMNI